MHKLSLKFALTLFSFTTDKVMARVKGHEKLSLCVISCLHGKPLPMTSLHKLQKLGEIIGKTDTVLYTVPCLTLPIQYIYLQMQRHPRRFLIKSPHQGFLYRKSDPSSIHIQRNRGHLQDLLTGCKIESHLPNGGIIHYSCQETNRRFLTPGPAGRALNCSTSGIARGSSQARSTHSRRKEPRSGGSYHRCLLQSLREWRIHKTL